MHAITRTQMFIAALFVIASNCDHPRWLLTGEWLNKLWYIQP